MPIVPFRRLAASLPLVVVCVGAPGSVLAQAPGSPVRPGAAAPDTSRATPWTRYELDADTLRSLPTDSLRDALSLLPGVFDAGGERGPSVRGAPAGETSFYLDGVWLRNLDSGRPSLLRIEPRQVASLALRPSFGAERGGAQAGVVELSSREGGRRWRGDVAFQTDQVTIGSGYGYSRADVFFGGPLAGERLTLSFAGTAVGREDARPTFAPEDLGRVTLDLGDFGSVSLPVGPTRWFRQSERQETFPVPAGGSVVLRGYDEITGLGARKPFNNGDEYSANLLLAAKPADGTALRLGFTASRDQRRFLVPSFQFRPQSLPARREKSYLLRADLSQRIGRTGSVRLLAGVARDEAMEGFLGETLADTLAVLREDKYPMRGDVLGFTIADFAFPFEKSYTVQRWLDRFHAMQNEPSLSYLAAFETLVNPATGQSFSIQQAANLFATRSSADNPYAINEFVTNGFTGFALSRERTLFARGETEWRAGAAGRLSAGAEVYRKHVEHLGYDTSPGGSLSSSAASSARSEGYEARPTVVGAWVKDRLQLGPAVVDAGVRLDGFSSDVAYPAIPGFVLPTRDAQTGATIRPEFVQPDADWQVSPRIAVAAPLRAHTRLHASVGRYAEIPPLEMLYGGVHIDLNKTNRNQVFGRPIGMSHVLAYELGVAQSIGSGTMVELTGYYRDRRNDAALRVETVAVPSLGIRDLLVLTDRATGTQQGVDLRAIHQFGQVATLGVTYGYTADRTEGSSDQSLGFLRVLDPTSDHAQSAAVTASVHTPADLFGARSPANRVLGGLQLSLAFHARDGLAYTRSALPGATALVVPPGAAYLERVNGSRLPWVHALDGRLAREVRMGGQTVVAYVDGRNLLNRQNVLDVFSVTRSAVEPPANFLAANTFTFARVRGEDIILANMPGQTAVDVTLRALLQRREQTFGNADGVFTVEEQARSSLASFLAAGWTPDGVRFPTDLFGTPRQVRIGLEWRF